MKGLIEEYGFSLVSMIMIYFFIKASQVLYQLLTQLSQIHMKGLMG